MRIVAVMPSTGERTAGFSAHLMRKQVQDVLILAGFSRADAIYRAWEIGIDYDVLVIFPADFMVESNAVKLLLPYLKNYERVVGRCVSKFRGKGVGGISVYRSQVLPRLISYAKVNYNNSTRPESDPALKCLKCITVLQNTGYHEYELNYKEIYDRYQFQRIKHPRKVKSMLPMWKKESVNDLDFLAAVQGSTGLTYDIQLQKKPIEEKDYDGLIKEYQL